MSRIQLSGWYKSTITCTPREYWFVPGMHLPSDCRLQPVSTDQQIAVHSDTVLEEEFYAFFRFDVFEKSVSEEASAVRVASGGLEEDAMNISALKITSPT